MKFLKQFPIQNILDDKVRQSSQPLPRLQNNSNPYFSVKSLTSETALRNDIVFISSRFRSGSTLLWNLFRQTGLCTSLYEPFNERQWFDPKRRGNHVDNSHRGVDDYWAEYEGMQELEDLYDESWINKNLLMTQKSWDPLMKAFLEKAIELSPKRPVLQFNRIDLRLPWLKHHFPNAKFLHLYRNPRDQWCSFLTDAELMNKDDVETTYQDAFYLDDWCNDLSKHYPFLSKLHTEHPYQRFYYLWKLSYLFGLEYCDYSISFEQLVSDPGNELQKLFSAVKLENIPTQDLLGIFSAPAPDKWKKYANEQWFTQHEQVCEYNLTLFLTNQTESFKNLKSLLQDTQ
jgi:hypothetical protein